MSFQKYFSAFTAQLYFLNIWMFSYKMHFSSFLCELSYTDPPWNYEKKFNCSPVLLEQVLALGSSCAEEKALEQETEAGEMQVFLHLHPTF